VRRAREFRLLIVCMVGAAAASGAIALVEVASGRLLASVLSPFISDSGEWLQAAQAQKIRDGVFRAQAGHTHPLSLGEFLALAAPVAFGLAISARRPAARAQWFVALALIAGGAFATGSRGAFLAIAISMSLAAGIFALRFLRRAAAWRFRPAAGLALALTLLASPAIGVVAYQVIAGKTGASAARSSQDRVDQIEKAWPKIMARPVGGYGTGRAARVLGYWGSTLTIDNYYLTLALDYGLPGPLALAALLAGMGLLAMRRAAATRGDIAAIHIGLGAAAAALAVMRMIVSQTGNMSFLFVLLGALAGAHIAGRVAGGSRRRATAAAWPDAAPAHAGAAA
jgi:O-antigen ligase